MKIHAIDQGTTGTKTHSFDQGGSFQTLRKDEHRQIYPHAQWVEHDPIELLTHVKAGIELAPRGGSIALTNQGETIIAWDSKTKRPIYNAIVWQDARTEDRIQQLKAEGAEKEVMERAGLPLDCYFSASKFRWLLENVPEAESLRREKRLRLGTTDAFFIDNLTGRFVSDIATSSRTSLLNIKTGKWDERLCDLFGVPLECLPEIGPSAGEIAELPDRRMLLASIVDQQAALYGHQCRKAGDSKITFGTGAFALCITGAELLLDHQSGILPTIAWKIGTQPITYALDGGVYNAASAINWARQLGLFQEYAEIDPMGATSAISRGLTFVPALSGLGSPYWDRSAAGMWLGLGLETNRLDMMLAILEGIALRSSDVIAAMNTLTPLGETISVDGGLAKNNYFLRFLANALNRTILVPQTNELTGLGAALMAYGGIGMTPPSISNQPAKIDPMQPLLPQEHKKFKMAIERCRQWRD